MEKLLLLAMSFGIIGIGAYGGGIVTVPLIQHELVNKQELLTMEQVSQIVAIAQMTPGPIAVNAATFVGFAVSSIPGALIATGIVISPALIILTIFTFFHSKGESNEHFRRIRAGLRAGVMSLLIFATYSYGERVVEGWFGLAMAAVAFLVLTIFEGKVHPLGVIITCGLIGIAVF
ncbi:MAG: chromate transporter [Planctomycetota bacterium]